MYIKLYQPELNKTSFSLIDYSGLTTGEISFNTCSFAEAELLVIMFISTKDRKIMSEFLKIKEKANNSILDLI